MAGYIVDGLRRGIQFARTIKKISKELPRNKNPATWSQLEQWITQPWEHESGVHLRVASADRHRLSVEDRVRLLQAARGESVFCHQRCCRCKPSDRESARSQQQRQGCVVQSRRRLGKGTVVLAPEDRPSRCGLLSLPNRQRIRRRILRAVDCGESCAASKERTEATGVAENTGEKRGVGCAGVCVECVC